MARTQNFSEYVATIANRLQKADRADQTTILVREIAELRMQVQSMAQSMAAMASYQEIADRLAPTQAETALPASVQIDASQHLQLLDGFYALEYSDAGRAYRWTGPSLRFRFGVWVDRSVPVNARLHVLFAGNPANIAGMHLSVDDVRCQVRFDDRQKVFVATNIPTRSFNGLSIFEYELAGHHPDKDINDLRELGLPFWMFEVAVTEGAASNG